MPVIGFLTPTSPDAQADRLRAFRQGLKETGHIESENVTIAYRWAENQIDRVPELVADLVHRKVAVIATVGDQTALAAKAATTAITDTQCARAPGNRAVLRLPRSRRSRSRRRPGC